MPKVSIIIPVYNVEEYLGKCLDSAVNQTYKNLEIICINDCSSDNSRKILQEYKNNDDRIVIIDLEKNRGISAARNAGLDVASGEYIYFLDSDDWIDPDYIEKMVEAIHSANVDVVYNNTIEIGKYSSNYFNREDLNKFSNTFIDAKKAILTIPWNVWAYLWKKTFLERINIKFPEGYKIEDLYFQMLTLCYLDELFIINGSAYHYLIKGIPQKPKNNVQTILKTYNLIYEEYKKKGLLEIPNIRILPNILTVFKQCLDENFDLKVLKEYFQKIQGHVCNNTSIYSKYELSVFEDVLNDNAVSFEKYIKLYLIEKNRLKNRK